MEIYLPYAAAVGLSHIEDVEDFRLFLNEVGLTNHQLEKAAQTVQSIPVPDSHVKRVTMARSAIHGYGMFANENLSPEDVIAPAMIGRNWTILGRFANHSKIPNCRMQKDGEWLSMVAIHFIGRGAELTVNYRRVREVLA